MLSAEEFFLSKLNPSATGGLFEIETETAIEIAIEFAKEHVKIALQKALASGIINHNHWDGYYIEDNSILSAYSPENIK